MFNLLRKCDWSTRRRRVRRRACAGCSASVSRRCASGWTSATPTTDRTTAPTGRTSTTDCAGGSLHNHRTRLFPNGWVTTPQDRVGVGVTTPARRNPARGRRAGKPAVPDWWVTTPQDRIGVGVTTPARRNPARGRRAGKPAVPDWWVTTPQDRVGVGVTTQKEPADV